jgi:hypothetical protein
MCCDVLMFQCSNVLNKPCDVRAHVAMFLISIEVSMSGSGSKWVSGTASPPGQFLHVKDKLSPELYYFL